jgi:aspartate aminotransferase
VNDRVKEMWAAGENVYHLAFGESRFPVHPKVAEALCRNVQKRSYLPAAGIPELREAIAAHYRRVFDMDVAPGQVVTGPGSKSLLYAALLALGEELIIPQPSWVTYGPQAHLLGKPVTWIPTWQGNRYQIELETLKEKLQESYHYWGNPEVLIVNSPGNPTGTMMAPDEVKTLAEFARENDLMVVSDEIYARTAFGEIPHVSPAQHYPEGTLVMGGLSKDLSLGGWRFGCAVLPPNSAGKALAKAMTTIATNIWSCVAAPVQYAALVAYSGDPEIDEYVQLCARIHAIRTRYLFRLMDDLGVPCAEPTGAFYIFPSFDPWKEKLASMGVHDDEDLALHLLDNYEIAALPGSAFNAARDLCLRLSSSFIDANTDEDADALVDAYRANPDPEAFIRDHHPRLQEVAQRFGDFMEELKK